MSTSDFLAQYNISADNLSPQVKDGLTEVLRKAGTEALAQLGNILAAKQKELGVGTGTTDSAAKQKADQAAAEAALAEQQKADADKKKRQQVYILLGVVGAGLLGALVWIIIKRKQQAHGG